MSTIYNEIITEDSNLKLSFLEEDDISYRLLIKHNCKISFEGLQKNKLQRMTIILQQYSDGNHDIEFDSIIKWKDKQPFVDTRGSYITIVEIMFDGTSQFYGRLIYDGSR